MLRRFKSIRGSLILTVFLALLMSTSASQSQAQLSQDVKDVFEGMIPSLDRDLQARFREAIKQDTPRVEFTAREFLRFRRHPANPFDGLDRIDIGDGQDRIVLKFELPSLRDRVPGRHERQHSRILKPIQDPARLAARSTVEVLIGDAQVALGTVVNGDGYILTKASEIAGVEPIECRLFDGRQVSARRIDQDQLNDLAILKIDVSGLTPVQWSSSQPELGSFLLTPDVDGSLIAMGTYSVGPRSTVEGERAFLGVQPVTTQAGVQVSEIRPGAASFKAGLRDGDIITRLGNRLITDVAGLVKSIRDLRPGDQVKIEYRRDGEPKSTIATLGGATVSSERAARFKMMNRLGAIPSQRDGDFPDVFQHDTPLFPEQCGGPIVDLEGRVVGINIARRGRAASFAIPAETAQRVTESLLQKSTARVRLNTPSLN